MKAYNLDSVTVTDRAATGSTPDGAPATGGGGTGGGGGPITLGGDATGPSNTNVVTLLSGVTSIRKTPIGYATGGNVQIRFDLGS